LIFEKALEEPKYSSLYAQLCHRLCEDSPNFDTSSNVTTFRRLLLNKCQDEFENRSHATEAFDKKDVRLTDEECEQYHIVKKKMLGNIKFIGELGKLAMLHEGILHKCIKQLLEKKKNSQLRDMSEDLECLCQIMRTIGPRIDTPKARAWMDQYFERIHQFALNEELVSRIRFMLQDVIELRNNGWKPRNIARESGPKTMSQIRQEAGVNVRGGPTPAQLNASRVPHCIPGLRGGMNDLFGVPVSGMATAIGVGPGVIQMDSFSSTNSYTSNNRNRFNNQNNNPSYQNNFQNNFSKGRGKAQESGGGSPNSQRRTHQSNGGSNSNGYGSPITNGFSNSNGFGGSSQNSREQSANKQGAMSRDLPPRFQRMAQQQPHTVGSGLGERSLGSTNSAPIGAPGQPSPSTSPPTVAPPSHTNSNGGMLSKEEVSLRPVKNFTMFKPNTPSMLPRSAQAQHPAPRESGFAAKKSTDISEMLNPLLDKQQHQQPKPTIMKQTKEEKKNNLPVKEKMTKEKMIDKLTYLMSECYVSHSLADAVADIKEMNVPAKMIPELLAHIMLESLQKSETEQELSMKLIDDLRSDGIISADQFIKGFSRVCQQMSELETDIPLVKSHVAGFGAMALTLGLVTMNQLAEPLHGGVHYPLFLLCLQHAHRVKDKEWLSDHLTRSKLDLLDMLPDMDQTKERLLTVLEDRGLSFLLPLLRLQADLGRQIAAEPSATALYKWLKDKVDVRLHTDSGFITTLVTALMKYITNESTLKENADSTVTPEKAMMDKEKELLDKLKGVLQMFLHDHTDLQMSALYAVQVYCHNQGFPKGMFLRFFVNLYDMEVIDEDIYLKWKEEVNDQYPGKGKALFQVNQWLNWLEQAEEDDSEEEEDD